MIWERDQIVRLLREQGHNDRAFLAHTQLPLMVDTEVHANLLHEYFDVSEAWLVEQASTDQSESEDDTGVV
ncbi:MAG TPA: hypothetical protein VFK52_08830 [Nocardioidaceae bacterium]|nr:hypothetical protein [Nocardioidaceae bacterium]